MKEYKFIHQKLTPIRKDQDYEDLLNSYAKMGWVVKSTFVHRGTIKSILERKIKTD